MGGECSAGNELCHFDGWEGCMLSIGHYCVNVVVKRCEAEIETRLRAEVGNFDQARLRAAGQSEENRNATKPP